MNPSANHAFAAGPSESVVERRFGFLTHWKRRVLEAALRRKLAAEPENTVLLQQLATFYESDGRRTKASEVFTTLAGIARRRRDVSDLAYYCRKLDILGCPYRAKVFRELATLYGETGDHHGAARACAQVVDLYISQGHATSAAGYIRALPPLGALAETVRTDLERRVEAARHPAQDRVANPSNERVRQTQPLIDQVAEAERSFEDLDDALLSSGGEVFLSGTIGRITQFDIVQMIESNALTGRLDITVERELGIVFFDSGRMVAARFGDLKGHDAARRIFQLHEAAFRVVVTDCVPGDELNVATNTGFLLELLKTEDEEALTSDASDPADYATKPLGVPVITLVD